MAKTLVLQIYAVIFYDCQEIDFLEKDQVWQKSQKKERNKLFLLWEGKRKNNIWLAVTYYYMAPYTITGTRECIT